MNLRISALEKVARIGCKYELSFLLYSLWALPSGGFAEGQLAVVFASGSSIWSEGIQLGWETGINRGSGLTNTACDAGGF